MLRPALSLLFVLTLIMPPVYAQTAPQQQAAIKPAAPAAPRKPAVQTTARPGSVSTPVSTIAYVPRAEIADRFEIEAAKIAIQRGQRKDVKDFAQMMVDDHSKSATKFTDAVKASKLNSRPVGLDTDHLNLLEQLRTASTSAFDYTYVTQQLAAHEKALKLHQGYAAAGDKAPLKAVARDTTPVVERHLQEIRRISATIAAPTS